MAGGGELLTSLDTCVLKAYECRESPRKHSILFSRVPSIEERKKFCLSSSFFAFKAKNAMIPITKDTKTGSVSERMMRDVDALLYCKDPSSKIEK